MNFSKTSKASAFALMLTVNMILFSLYGGIFRNMLGADSLLFLIVSQLCVYLPPIWAYFFITRESPRSVFSLKAMGIKNILLIIGISIFIQPFLMLVSTLSSYVFGTETSDYIKSFSSLPIYYTVLSTSVFPAVFEELSFRGIVFSNLRSKSLLKACLFTGLLFGMAHLNGEQFFYAFFMGAVFCYLVYKTGSLAASMLSHFTINFTQTMLTLYYIKTGVYDTAPQANFSASILSAVMLTLYMLAPLILLFALFEYTNRRHETGGIIIEHEEDMDYSDDIGEKLISVPFILFAVIFVVYAIFI